MRISDWSSDVCSSDLLIAREISALLTLGVHLPLNHHLRGDARMISANHQQRILAAQPFITDHDILKCIVKRMADMERAGHVGWRIDNSEGLRVGAFRTEQSLAFPMRITARLQERKRDVEGRGVAGR